MLEHLACLLLRFKVTDKNFQSSSARQAVNQARAFTSRTTFASTWFVQQCLRDVHSSFDTSSSNVVACLVCASQPDSTDGQARRTPPAVCDVQSELSSRKFCISALCGLPCKRLWQVNPSRPAEWWDKSHPICLTNQGSSGLLAVTSILASTWLMSLSNHALECQGPVLDE